MQQELSMFFLDISEKLAEIPQYFIEDLMQEEKNFKFTEDNRCFIGKGSYTQKYVDSTAQTKTELSNILNFLYSQQFTVLKNLVASEIAIVNTPASPHVSPTNTRYINRIGEQIIIPINYQISITSNEFKKSTILDIGSIYRINSRTDLTFVSNANTIALSIIYIDFDLNKFLLPHDKNSVFPRRKDEYLDSSKVQEPKVTPSAY
jgi:hypothetical protein